MIEPFKCLSLTQPWATGVALEVTGWETRSWSTKYRGPLGIHAAKGFPRWAKDFARTEHVLGRLPGDPLPLGAIIAVVDLLDVLPTGEAIFDTSAIERLWGDYSPGRFAWRLGNIRKLEQPIPCKGALGLWSPTPELVRAINEQLMAA